MAKVRKIAECVNLRINFGNFQHLEFVKYAEEEIEYTTDAERIEQEDKMRNTLVSNIIRTMEEIPVLLKKRANETKSLVVDQNIADIQKIDEAVKSRMPDWLKNGDIPNIANQALKREIQVTAEQKAIIDQGKNFLKEDEPKVVEKIVEKVIVKTEEKPVIKEEVTKEEPKIDNKKIEELFDDDPVIENKEVKIEDLFDDEPTKVSSTPVTPVVQTPKVTEVKEVSAPKQTKIEVDTGDFDFGDEDFLDV